MGGLLKADKENNGGHEMSIRNTLYLMDDHPEIDEEIAIHIKSLMQDMKKLFDLDLPGDDRGSIAYEAVAKWVVDAMGDKVFK